MTGIADTGFLVAFANRKDLHHDWAVEVASRIDHAQLTCDAVLAETAFHLENLSLVLAMVQEGLVLPKLQVSEHLLRLAELAVFDPLPPITGPRECKATDVVKVDAVLLPDEHRVTFSPPAGKVARP